LHAMTVWHLYRLRCDSDRSVCIAYVSKICCVEFAIWFNTISSY
jgi:hypothetical protein